MADFEEVIVRDDDGNVIDSYVDKVIDTYAGEDPPDDYDDTHYEEDFGHVPPGWNNQAVTVLPVGVYDSRGYSDEPPF